MVKRSREYEAVDAVVQVPDKGSGRVRHSLDGQSHFHWPSHGLERREEGQVVPCQVMGDKCRGEQGIARQLDVRLTEVARG